MSTYRQVRTDAPAVQHRLHYTVPINHEPLQRNNEKLHKKNIQAQI